MVVRILVMDAAQFRGVVVIPAVELLPRDRMRLLNAAGQRIDQPVFKRGGAVRELARDLDVLERNSRRRISLRLAMIAPGKIVERSASIGDAPMRHDAFGVEFERLAKTLYAFRFIESEAPVETQVKPALRLH